VVKLELIGANRTLLPFLDAAERAAELIVDDLFKLRQIQSAPS
jgi:thiazole synthase ThiGH ThiG subunit